MALFNIFKKEKGGDKNKPKEPKKIKAERPVKKVIRQLASKKEKKAEIAPLKKSESPAPKERKEKGEPGDAYRILKKPRVTEKATELAEKNKYVFEVWPDANKTEVKKTVERIYGVNVVSVRIINIKKKPRRLGRNQGWRKGYKKAIVRLVQGHTIEMLPR